MRIVWKAIYPAASEQIVADPLDMVNKICTQRIARLTHGQPNRARYQIRDRRDYRMEVPALRFGVKKGLRVMNLSAFGQKAFGQEEC